MQVTSQKRRPSRLISVMGTSKKQLDPGQENMGQVTVLLRCCLLNNP
jgi:hypothetical protein